MYLLHLLFAWPSTSEYTVFAFALMLGIFWIQTIFEIATSKFAGKNSKLYWILIVFFLGIIGLIIYRLVGRDGRIIETN